MRAVIALTIKDLRLLIRDRAGFFVTFVFPLVYAVFFGVIFGNNSGGGFSTAAHRSNLPENLYAASFPLGIVWGVLGCTAGFALSLVVERTRGTLQRLRIAPIQRAQILLGKAGACFATTVALGVALFVLALTIFAVHPQSWLKLLWALISIAIAFVGLMMFLSVFGKTERAASGITWTTLLAMAMLGGGMVPRFLMPAWLQRLGDVSPVRWAIFAMEGAVWRDLSWMEMLKPCAVLIAIGVTLFSIGAVAFGWTASES